MEAVNGVSEVDKGGPAAPSPLTGCYLLVVVGEPHSKEHKDIILQRIAKGLLSWDMNDCHVDLEKELTLITEEAPEGEEARYGERLIQFASENLVTEVLIHPAVSTLSQCMKNLLSSFTCHRHIIHAGYTFATNGSWILQDGTFSLTDFSEAFQETEVQRVLRAYDSSITLDIHCSSEGDWIRLPKESFTKNCKVRVNPDDVLTSGSPAIVNFLNYLSPFLTSTDIETLLESSDVVGNIRFSHPTLYVFPGGQGDAALFGINGFNMLVDGGFARKACFWDFVRHLDRLDAVLLTRLNNSNVSGISSVLRRKRNNTVYPQIGHFFCNIQERKSILSPDGDKDKDPLLINLLEEGQEIVGNLRQLHLQPQVCYRDAEPINLYHKVGHGTLDMYVLSPARESKEVREFLQKWNTNDQRLFANIRNGKDFSFPIQNLVSICALLVWQPANANDSITRILFPGSTPQHKIFEGLDRLKQLECIKHPTCSAKTLTPNYIKSKQAKSEKIIQQEQKTKEKIVQQVDAKAKIENKIAEANIKNAHTNGVVTERIIADKIIKKHDSTESEKSGPHSLEMKKSEDVKNGTNLTNGKVADEKISVDKPKPKGKLEQKPKTDAKPFKQTKPIDRKPKPPVSAEKKASPTTPKKTLDSKTNGEAPTKPRFTSKLSPSATPAKSAKDANNRKVVESKYKSTVPPKRETAKPEKKDVKQERKPISRRPKGISPTGKAPESPVKKVSELHKMEARKPKLEKEGTTDSSTVSTPSADVDTLLKKDISKLTPEELDQLKAREMAELKEEQEVVKEIEAVFRKSEQKPGVNADLRKVKDISVEEKTDGEEYLIIEKEEIEHDSLEEKEIKESETQKMLRDSEESEKQKKSVEAIKPEIVKIEEEKTSVEPKIGQEVVAPQIDTPQTKEEKEKPKEVSKEMSVTSPDDKIDISSGKKVTDEENKDVNVLESQPDEKFSTPIESGATTAPTLPEDERIPLDEIKEDNGDQVIEEKYVKEDTKEKGIPVVQLPPKSTELITKPPTVVGIKLDKQTPIRDLVKTPDEVADLPVHEEVDIDNYDHYQTTPKQEDTKLTVGGAKVQQKPSEIEKLEKLEEASKKPEELKENIPKSTEIIKQEEMKVDKTTEQVPISNKLDTSKPEPHKQTVTELQSEKTEGKVDKPEKGELVEPQLKGDLEKEKEKVDIGKAETAKLLISDIEKISQEKPLETKVIEHVKEISEVTQKDEEKLETEKVKQDSKKIETQAQLKEEEKSDPKKNVEEKSNLLSDTAVGKESAKVEPTPLQVKEVTVEKQDKIAEIIKGGKQQTEKTTTEVKETEELDTNKWFPEDTATGIKEEQQQNEEIKHLLLTKDELTDIKVSPSEGISKELKDKEKEVEKDVKVPEKLMAVDESSKDTKKELETAIESTMKLKSATEKPPEQSEKLIDNKIEIKDAVQPEKKSEEIVPSKDTDELQKTELKIQDTKIHAENKVDEIKDSAIPSKDAEHESLIKTETKTVVVQKDPQPAVEKPQEAIEKSIEIKEEKIHVVGTKVPQEELSEISKAAEEVAIKVAQDSEIKEVHTVIIEKDDKLLEKKETGKPLDQQVDDVSLIHAEKASSECIPEKALVADVLGTETQHSKEIDSKFKETDDILQMFAKIPEIPKDIDFSDFTKEATRKEEKPIDAVPKEKSDNIKDAILKQEITQITVVDSQTKLDAKEIPEDAKDADQEKDKVDAKSAPVLQEIKPIEQEKKDVLPGLQSVIEEKKVSPEAALPDTTSEDIKAKFVTSKDEIKSTDSSHKPSETSLPPENKKKLDSDEKIDENVLDNKDLHSIEKSIEPTSDRKPSMELEKELFEAAADIKPPSDFSIVVTESSVSHEIASTLKEPSLIAADVKEGSPDKKETSPSVIESVKADEKTGKYGEKDLISDVDEKTVIQSFLDDSREIDKVDKKLQELKDAVEDVKKEVLDDQQTKLVDKLELGRKSPKEREHDVAKIVASVAEVLKSDAPLEEFEGKIPLEISNFGQLTPYSTELRETHITTVESPIREEIKPVEIKAIAKDPISAFLDEERKISSVQANTEELDNNDSKVSSLIKESTELIQATSKIISDIKHSSKVDDQLVTEEATKPPEQISISAKEFSVEKSEESILKSHVPMEETIPILDTSKSPEPIDIKKDSLETREISDIKKHPDDVSVIQEQTKDKLSLDKPLDSSEKSIPVTESVIKDAESDSKDTLEIEKSPTASGKITPEFINGFEDTKSLSGKTSPDITEREVKPSVEDVLKSSPPSQEDKGDKKSEDVDKIKLGETTSNLPKLSSGKITPDIVLEPSEKETPEIIEPKEFAAVPEPPAKGTLEADKASVGSGKSTPDLLEPSKDTLNASRSPSLSGRSTPDIVIDEVKAVSLSGKSSPDIEFEEIRSDSIKTSVASHEPLADEEDKDKSSIKSFDSGKSSPDIKDRKDDDKAELKVEKEEKDKISIKSVDSGKSSPDIKITKEDVVDSGKSSPDLKDDIKAEQIVKKDLDFGQTSPDLGKEGKIDVKADTTESYSKTIITMASGKSTPEVKLIGEDKSGKSSPDIKDIDESKGKPEKLSDEARKIKTDGTKEESEKISSNLTDIITKPPEEFKNLEIESTAKIELVRHEKSTGLNDYSILEPAPLPISSSDSPKMEMDSKNLKSVSEIKSGDKPLLDSDKSTVNVTVTGAVSATEDVKQVPDKIISELKDDVKKDTVSATNLKDLEEKITDGHQEDHSKKEEPSKIITSAEHKESTLNLGETAKITSEISIASTTDIKHSEAKITHEIHEDLSKTIINTENVIGISGKATPDLKETTKLISEPSTVPTKDLRQLEEKITHEKHEDNFKKEEASKTVISTERIIDTSGKSTPDLKETTKLITETVSAKTEEIKIESVAGPSSSSKEIVGQPSPSKSPVEDLELSRKSTPDIADVAEKESILGGKITPPTVPVSPIVKEKHAALHEEDDAKKDIPEISALKSVDVRSSTPASDDFDISSGQVSRVLTTEEEDDKQVYSDDEDLPGSPLSATSQVAHSISSQYDFEDSIRGMPQIDPMSTSFYGALPDDPMDLTKGANNGRFLDDVDIDFDKALQEHRQTRGEDIVASSPALPVSPSHVYEVTTAKYSSMKLQEDMAKAGTSSKTEKESLMTASFIGSELPADPKDDPIASWGKPLGLPSPAPLNDNKGTPKKERKIPPNVMAKNKLNEDKRLTDSKYDRKGKKINPVYVDLTYVPHHGNSNYSYVDFFKRVRARYYVFSGIEPSKEVYGALLEAKQTWDDKDLEVTIIPTYDTDVLGYWVAENEDLLTKYKIDLSPSASRCTINLQDHETSCSAYRLEFS